MRQHDLFGQPDAPAAGVFIPAITLWQPWCSLLFSGHKVHETRSWEIPARLVGRRVAIHAAATPTADRHIDEPLRKLASVVFGSGWQKSIPYGAVLGTCILSGCARVEDVRDHVSPDDLASGIWTDGRWAWILDDVSPFPAPIPAQGAQGFWNWRMPA